MSLYDLPVRSLKGEPASLADHKGKALLIVNVASRCGFTPQYEGLKKIQDAYAGRGFSVLGFPCNQFGGQEPGSPDEIDQFCSTTYGIDFPIYEKVEVNGEGRHPLFEELTQAADENGESGDIRWNFEKFLVSPEGEIVRRFRTLTTPEDPALIDALERVLPD